jgi:hypothetical protein
MSRLLCQVTCGIDGSRDPVAITKLVSDDLGRSLNADQVRRLISANLLPLGIVAAEGARPPRRRPTRCSPSERGARCCPKAPGAEYRCRTSAVPCRHRPGLGSGVR